MDDLDLTHCCRYDFVILQKDIKVHFGKRLTEFRDGLNLSQEALATLTKVERNTISRYEQGKAWPKYRNLIALAAQLGVTPADFFDFKEMPKVRKTSPEEALKVLAELVESTRKSKINVTPAPLADALRAALKDSEFKYVATAIKNITGGRVQLELPDEEDQASN